MKNQISFTTDLFETRRVEGSHFGQDLARWFIEAASGGSFSFGEPFQEEWGWAVPVEGDGEQFVIKFEIMDASIGDNQADWLITVEKLRKWKYFSSKDSNLRSELCDLVQNVLRNKAHIREIRWTGEAGHFAPKKAT